MNELRRESDHQPVAPPIDAWDELIAKNQQLRPPRYYQGAMIFGLIETIADCLMAPEIEGNAVQQLISELTSGENDTLVVAGKITSGKTTFASLIRQKVAPMTAHRIGFEKALYAELEGMPPQTALDWPPERWNRVIDREINDYIEAKKQVKREGGYIEVESIIVNKREEKFIKFLAEYFANNTRIAILIPDPKSWTRKAKLRDKIITASVEEIPGILKKTYGTRFLEIDESHTKEAYQKALIEVGTKIREKFISSAPYAVAERSIGHVNAMIRACIDTNREEAMDFIRKRVLPPPTKGADWRQEDEVAWIAEEFYIHKLMEEWKIPHAMWMVLYNATIRPNTEKKAQQMVSGSFF